jgi:hypothetical protein
LFYIINHCYGKKIYGLKKGFSRKEKGKYFCLSKGILSKTQRTKGCLFIEMAGTKQRKIP